MGQSFDFDPSLAQTLIAELTAIAEAAHQDLTELRNALAREGKPWGDDEPGRTIGHTYEPEAEKGLTGYGNLVDNLRGLRTGLADANEAFQSQDRAGAQRITASGRPSSGPNQPLTYLATPAQQSPGPFHSAPPLHSAGSFRSARPPTNSEALSGNGTQSPSNASGRPAAAQPEVTPGNHQQSPIGDPRPRTPGHSPFGATPTADNQPWRTDPGAVTPGEQDTTSRPGANGTSEGVSDAVPPTVPDSSPQTAPPPTTLPPATPLPATPPPGAAAPRPGEVAATGKSTATPWSRASAAPMSPNSPATPWAGGRSAAGHSGQISPPPLSGNRSGAAKPGTLGRDGKARKKKQQAVPKKAAAVTTDAAALAAAQDMAARHGLRLTGFDTSGISEHTVTDIATALDDVLGKYPFLGLGGIEITDLGDGRISRVARDRADTDTAAAHGGPWILLDRALVADRTRLGETVCTAVQSGELVTGSRDRPMYSVILTDLGVILERSAGATTRQLAQRALITEYRRINGPWDHRNTLASIVGGYRLWRNQLTGNSIAEDRFQPRAALVAAFVEVELSADTASGPARVLYRLLVETARGRSSPP
ncbi:WXG100 family type VII secretion target [Nocardia jejuensis]|uniref:WXG100 family type VII secretion target n=1 Tax=Nocardia jejuensis TaxID=328049 RepID=UPI000A9CB5E4|nr:hypothetical protein [Nocardia jejuensis]